MEFIKLEQFKSLNQSIQKVLVKWWKPKKYDLYIDSSDLSQVECLDYINNNDEGIIYYSMRDNMSIIEDMIPLLTEGQLRKFILDKTNMNYIETKMIHWSSKYTMLLRNGDMYLEFKEIDKDFLQAYWKIAVEIAKEEV